MKHATIYLTLCAFFMCMAGTAHAQYPEQPDTVKLYYSQQTGEKSSRNGNYSHTTGKHESGSVAIGSTGAVSYTVTPAGTSIDEEQTKSWTGTLEVNGGAAPPAGESAAASLTGDWTVSYSRPQGAIPASDARGSETSVVPWANIDPTSGDTISMHEMVTREGNEVVDIKVISIDIDVPDTILCTAGVAHLSATVYPPYVTDIIWTLGSTTLSGNDLDWTIPTGTNTLMVSATMSVDGVTASDDGQIIKGHVTDAELPYCIDTVQQSSAITTVTYSSGCEPAVTYSPDSIKPGSSAGQSVVSVTVSDGTYSATDSTIAVNKGDISSVTLGDSSMSITVGDYSIEVDLSAISDLAEDVTDGLPTGPSVEAEFTGPDGSVTFSEGLLCCTDSLKDRIKIEGALEVGASVTATIPLYGFPYLATIDAVIGAGVTGNISANAATTCESFEVCAGATLTATVSGGVGFSIGGGVVSASLTLNASASATGNLCFIPPPVTGSVSGNVGSLSVTGTVTTLGFWSHSVTYPICSGYAIGPYNF